MDENFKDDLNLAFEDFGDSVSDDALPDIQMSGEAPEIMKPSQTEEPIAEVKEEAKEQPIAEVREDIEAQPIAEVREDIEEQPIAEVREDIKEQPIAEVREDIEAQPIAETEQEQIATNASDLSDKTVYRADMTASELAAVARRKRIEERRALQEKRRARKAAIRAKKKDLKSSGGGFFKRTFFAAYSGVIFGLFAVIAIFCTFKCAEKLGVDIIPKSVKTESKEAVREKKTPAPLENEPVQHENDDIATSGLSGTLVDASFVAEKCMPSIVAVTNKYTETYQSFWGMPNQVQAESSGSGIIVGENESELLIVTNSHVIESADELYVKFCDDTVVEATIKGKQSQEDLAIITVALDSISEETENAISIATLGDSDSLRVGEPAIAIGNSLGYGQSVTCGIISAVDRDFEYESGSRKVIQTDAAINPGNSGGALINIRGEVIGINEAKYSSTAVEGVGYAIPISTAKPIIDKLATKTTRTPVENGKNGFLGVGGVDVTADVAKMYGMPVGVYISQVSEGSAAEEAGIKKGDVITAFDGEGVSSMEELRKVIGYYSAGETVEVDIQRMANDGYEPMTISVTLGEKPEE